MFFLEILKYFLHKSSQYFSVSLLSLTLFQQSVGYVSQAYFISCDERKANSLLNCKTVKDRWLFSTACLLYFTFLLFLLFSRLCSRRKASTLFKLCAC